MKLMDRIAVVTGAGSGIGRATALMFAREGARVAVVDLAEATAKATAEEIERAGGQARAMRADVSRTRPTISPRSPCSSRPTMPP